MTRFAAMHPGGEHLLLEYAGKDTSKEFWGLHRADVLRKFGPKLIKGQVEGVKSEPILEWSEFSTIPYSEPSNIRPGWASPYYTEKHTAFRKAFRELLEKEFRPWALQAEESNEYPSVEFSKKLGSVGIHAALSGGGSHLKFGPALPGGVKPEEFDLFMEGIVHEEFGRIGAPGATDAIVAGMVISLPVVVHFLNNNKPLQEKCIREVLSGEKRICLAVTEAFAGSDVANIRTTAVKSADGSHYIINGTKKWISMGMQSDYFVTLARTGGPGAGGLSYFLVPRSEGLETKQISTSYSKSAGTAYIIYENVKVPADHLVGGKEGRGFVQAMNNFTKERWLIIGRMISSSRYAVEDCWKWSLQREVFGKPLMTQPVISWKFGEMCARLESVQNWYENMTFQMTKMSFEEQGLKLSGPMALLKFETTRIGSLIADQAPQIFGGRGITKSGMGMFIERFCRSAKFGAILGGSEEVLNSQAIKLAQREPQTRAKL